MAELSTLGSVIKTAYEAEADTNAFDDAAVSKLAGIETGATADQTGAEIKVALEAEADTNTVTDAEKVVIGNTSGTNTGDESAASDTVAGVVELATITETNAGTDDTRAVTPAGLAGSALAGTVNSALQPGANISTLTNDSGFTDDTAANAAQADATSAKTKTDFITVTQAVDLDAIESRVNELDASVVLKGEWDASVGTFPGAGVAQAGWSYIVSVGGTVDGVEFVANDRIVAIFDNASTTTYLSNWLKLDYTDAVLSVAGLTGAVSASSLRTALNVADGATDDTAANAAQATANAAVPKALFDANTVLAANVDDTPAAVPLVEQTVLGRITSGNIKGLTPTEIRTLINVADGATDDTIARQEIYTFDIPTVANQDYTLWYYAPFAGTITTVGAKSDSGTCTMTTKIGSTALGGTANNVSDTYAEQSHASSNTFVKGDVIKITISANSSCLNLAGILFMTRAA